MDVSNPNKMKKAVISGDIVSSTSLNNSGKQLLEEALRNLLADLRQCFDVFGRLVKGDYLECVIADEKQALQVMLAIKAFVKSIELTSATHASDPLRFKHFSAHGIRLAMGYGTLDRYEPQNGIIDGEAIYWSGRKINEESTHKKSRVSIKQTLFFISDNEPLNSEMEMVLAFLDVLLTKATPKQCIVLYLKLKGFTEEQIAKHLTISQPVVNRHSSAIGYHAIEKALEHFSNTIKP